MYWWYSYMYYSIGTGVDGARTRQVCPWLLYLVLLRYIQVYTVVLLICWSAVLEFENVDCSTLLFECYSFEAVVPT